MNQAQASAPSATKRVNQYGGRVDRQAIIDTYSKAPQLSQPEIAKLNNCDSTTVCKVLKEYAIEQADVESFKNNRADILAGIQQRIAKSINDEEIKKAPLQVKAMMFGVFYDKERLERGQSTENVLSVNVIKRLDDKQAELADMLRRINSDPITLCPQENKAQPIDMDKDSGVIPKLTNHTLSDTQEPVQRRRGRPRKAR